MGVSVGVIAFDNTPMRHEFGGGASVGVLKGGVYLFGY